MSETVYVIAMSGTQYKYYHTEECRIVRNADTEREITEEQKDRMDLEECTYCAGEHTTDNYTNKYQEILKQKAEEYAQGDD
jgi:hypothetical protein